MKTAWFVDDDQEVVIAIQQMLQLLDYDARSFLSAQEAAKALVAGDRPDILILDINMPKVSGINLLEFIRRQEKWNDIPILMLSSDATDLQVARTLSMGADGYLFKPVLIDELEMALFKAIEKREHKNH